MSTNIVIKATKRYDMWTIRIKNQLKIQYQLDL